MNSIWENLQNNPSGQQFNCTVNNQGDPIVQYDQIANRWLISQFGFPRDVLLTGLPTPPYDQCIAISKTPDPTGAYYLYDFRYSKHDLQRLSALRRVARRLLHDREPVRRSVPGGRELRGGPASARTTGRPMIAGDPEREGTCASTRGRSIRAIRSTSTRRSRRPTQETLHLPRSAAGGPQRDDAPPGLYERSGQAERLHGVASRTS